MGGGPALPHYSPARSTSPRSFAASTTRLTSRRLVSHDRAPASGRLPAFALRGRYPGEPVPIGETWTAGRDAPQCGQSSNRLSLPHCRRQCGTRFRGGRVPRYWKAEPLPTYLPVAAFRSSRPLALMLANSAGPASPPASPSAQALRRKASRASSVCSMIRKASRTTSLAEV